MVWLSSSSLPKAKSQMQDAITGFPCQLGGFRTITREHPLTPSYEEGGNNPLLK